MKDLDFNKLRLESKLTGKKAKCAFCRFFNGCLDSGFNISRNISFQD